MFGAPPNCRPECVIHQDCPHNRACIRQRCEDPCIGACGFNAICTAQNHRPTCSCIEGHEGDPYAGCNLRQSEYKLFFYNNFNYVGRFSLFSLTVMFSFSGFSFKVIGYYCMLIYIIKSLSYN